MQTLVERTSRLDPDAWESLYRRSYGALFGYARRRLRSVEAAEDAVSETMMRALDRIHSFDGRREGIEPWLFGILRNVVLESHRSDARSSPVADAPVAVVDETPVDLRLLADEELCSLRRAFGRLERQDQELLELRVVAGLSAEAVATVQGRRPGAVRMAQSRALARLRLLMAEEAQDA